MCVYEKCLESFEERVKSFDYSADNHGGYEGPGDYESLLKYWRDRGFTRLAVDCLIYSDDNICVPNDGDIYSDMCEDLDVLVSNFLEDGLHEIDSLSIPDFLGVSVHYAPNYEMYKIEGNDEDTDPYFRDEFCEVLDVIKVPLKEWVNKNPQFPLSTKKWTERKLYRN